jgi:hypothetical protein
LSKWPHYDLLVHGADPEVSRSGHRLRTPDERLLVQRAESEECTVKYLLVLHLNPEVMDALSEEEKQAIFSGHEKFMAAVKESGEMRGTVALAEPAKSAVVRVRDGAPAVTDGPYLESKEFLAGYYLLECDSPERAYELAAMIPDAGLEGMGVEVRPVVYSADV